MKYMARHIENSFVLSAVIIVAGIAALFFDKMAGSEFVALCGIMTTVYGASRYFIDWAPKE